MSPQTQPLRISQTNEEVIEFYLDPVKHPVAYKRKMHELTAQGLSFTEAERFIGTTPFIIEIYYELNIGVFAVESEAVEHCQIYNPYTGQQIAKAI